MFNKNAFTQKDPIADLVKVINEADYKAKMEALKGDQHKLDKNKNNKLDADDFKILRGEKKAMKEEQDTVEEGWDDMMKAVKDRSGPQPSGGSGVKQGSRYGGSKQKEKPEHDDEKTKKEEIDLNKVTTDTLAGRVKGKTSNPFAPKKVMMDVPDNVKEEVEQVDEGIMSNIEVKPAKKGGDSETLAKHDVHYKGKKIGHIEVYKHRSGMKYGDVHHATGEGTAGHRSMDAAIDSLRQSHAEHLNNIKNSASVATKSLIKLSKMKENVEQIDELDKTTLQKYKTAAHKSISANAVARHAGKISSAEYHKTADKRSKGINRADADKRLGTYADKKPKVLDISMHGSDIQKKYHSEEIESLDEAGTGLLMTFIKSKGLNPLTMDGNQKKAYARSSEFKLFKRRHMKETSGMGERGDDWNEENEMFKEAVDKNDTVTMDIPLLIRVLEYAREDAKTDMSLHKVVENLIAMRDKGVLSMDEYDAIIKINEVFEVEAEQIEERTLTKGETAEKERIVKGMKKSLAGFKKRYGERAKEVMYATATKAAKKD